MSSTGRGGIDKKLRVHGRCWLEMDDCWGEDRDGEPDGGISGHQESHLFRRSDVKVREVRDRLETNGSQY